MKYGRKRHPISSINIVPYVDVMLVLLVIFMITAPLFNQSLINVPSVGETPIEGAQTAGLEILYAGSSSYGLVDHINSDEQTDLSQSELTAALDLKKLLHGEEVIIIISAEESLPYKEVIHLLGQLRTAGYKNLNLSVKNQES